MNKYREFINYIEEMMRFKDTPYFVEEVLEELKSKADGIDNKPLFTDIGLQILEYMQSTDSRQKAKDIAEGMSIPSRKVSGAIRKLVSDKYVEKHGESPVIYSLTEQGKNFNIKNYKETNNYA